MDSKNIIASAISDNELARAFSELVAERWDNWDLTPFLPYLVDTCAPTALPYLADQFDVDGLRGFGMAITEAQQRDIIKKSIALHKYIGTPWAIREACRTVGFPVIVLEEGVTAIPGGPESPDDWARFRVLVEADIARHITIEESRKLRLFVEFYKNERSHLAELGYYQSFSDKLLREISEREVLDIMLLSVTPNPVYLTPQGTAERVEVYANVPWTIEQHVFDWNDSTEGKLILEFTGESGNSEIIISSDYYISQPSPARAYSSAYSRAYRLPDDDSRAMDIPIYSTDGRRIGVLTIIQYPGDNNAYSSAYSNAYNLLK